MHGTFNLWDNFYLFEMPNSFKHLAETLFPLCKTWAFWYTHGSGMCQSCSVRPLNSQSERAIKIQDSHPCWTCGCTRMPKFCIWEIFWKPLNLSFTKKGDNLENPNSFINAIAINTKVFAHFAPELFIK